MAHAELGRPTRWSAQVSADDEQPARRRLPKWALNTRLLAVLLAALFTVINLTWVLRDRTSPSFDQSHYLYMTWTYRHDLTWHGLHAMIHDVYTIDPGRGPMLSVALVPIAFFTDAGRDTGGILNVILWPIMLLCAGSVAARFYGERARLLAILLIAPMPELVALSHTTLQDFLLATLATLAIWLILRSDGFRRPLASAGLGLVITIGSLTKISFGTALALPMLVVLIGAIRRHWLDREQEQLWPAIRRQVASLTLMVLLATVIPVIWFVQNWAATKAYLNAAFMQQPGTLQHPLTVQNLGVFVMNTFNGALSWQIGLLGFAILLLSVPNALAWRRGWRPDFEDFTRWVFLGSWVAVPYLAVAISDNHDPRYSVATFPAAGVVLAGMVTKIRFPSARRVIAALTVVAAVTMTLQVESSRWRIPGVHETYAVQTRFGPAVIQLSRGLGPATLISEHDYASDVMNYLQSISLDSSGKVQPRSVAMLQLHGYINGNTMPYEATVRRVPFSFTTFFSDGNAATLAAQLKTVDYALYLSQPPSEQEEALGRVAQLNDTAAAHHMTPAMFALFEPNPHPIYVGPDAGQGDYIYVLVRKTLKKP